MSHSHGCQVCGHVFSHAFNPAWSAEQNVKAHCCPICSAGPFYARSNLQASPYVALPPSAVVASLVMLCMLRGMVLECDEYAGNSYGL